MSIQLSSTQQKILSHAAERSDGKLVWFPDNIKGGARTKVIESLSRRGLITPDETDWFVSEQGYRALGLPHREPIAPAVPDSVKDEQATQFDKPRSRNNSKQAQVIDMLKRPEGATIQQICQVTKWQSHTVRGSMAGVLKKKLGLVITSEKTENGERVYHAG